MTAPRHLVSELVGQTERGRYGECVYCGHPCTGLACRQHRDLLHNDPNYYEMRLRTEPLERNPDAHVH